MYMLICDVFLFGIAQVYTYTYYVCLHILINIITTLSLNTLSVLITAADIIITITIHIQYVIT